MLEKKKIASDPIINHIPWAARASAGRACGLLAGCFVALKSAGGLGMGGLGMVSKVVISVVLLGWLWSMGASGGWPKKNRVCRSLFVYHCSNGPNATNGAVLVQKGLWGHQAGECSEFAGQRGGNAGILVLIAIEVLARFFDTLYLNRLNSTAWQFR